MNNAKPRPVSSSVIEQLRHDLETDGVQIYSIKEIPPFLVDKNLLHPDVVARSTGAVAALSGCKGNGRDYLFISTMRGDLSGNSVVTDLDPIVFVYDTNKGGPDPSGVALFHSEFGGRTEYSCELQDSLSATVAEIQQNLSGCKLAFAEAPQRFTNAIHFTAQTYEKFFPCSGDATS